MSVQRLARPYITDKHKHIDIIVLIIISFIFNLEQNHSPRAIIFIIVLSFQNYQEGIIYNIFGNS